MVTILGKSEATITMILDNLESTKNFERIVLVNNLKLYSSKLYSHPDFTIDEYEDFKQFFNNLIIGVTNPVAKKKIFEYFGFNNQKYINVFHNNVLKSKTANVGIGIIMNQNSSINAWCKIGNHVTFNNGSGIGHHGEIGDFATLNPRVTVCGNCKIGEGALIGACAVIKNDITIGKWATIGMGAVVIKDVPDYAIAVGNPAKIIKYNNICY